MPNHLVHETSPYLLQHAENPVDWYPWGDDALERARAEDKPIFLSIGYSACHWCHVMEHESFEDLQTARLLNENFISIKVDREERPDLDQIYMTAVQLLTGGGGWPMSVFLTPDLRPFYGGTYFPPVSSYGIPSFKELLRTINHLWRKERDNLLRVSDRLKERLEDEASWHPHDRNPYDLSSLDRAVNNLEAAYDWENGGWNSAPKFPQTMAIEFLLLQAERGNESAHKMAIHALNAMERGGMYDVVGGGFHRYSTDAFWLIPHFEKMLYDNALLATTYLHAWLLTGETSFRQTAEATLDFALREMRHPSGGFFSSLDADSEQGEGKFYSWELIELRSLIPSEMDWKIFSSVYSLPDGGNFDGQIILQRTADLAYLSAELGLPVQTIQESLSRSREKLLVQRDLRPRPPADDKVLTCWNAFMLQALAEAGRCLNRADYLQAARQNADFLLSSLMENDRLLRSWREGKAHISAYLEDYAALIIALLELYQSDPEVRWFQAAWSLARTMNAEYLDQRGGYFDTSAAESGLLVRPKAMQDNATPAGNSLAAHALLMLAAYNDRGDLRSSVETLIGSLNYPSIRYPLAFGEWLRVLDLLIGPQRQVAVVYPQGKSPAQFLDALWKKFRPHMISAVSPLPLTEGSPEILQFRPAVHDQPTAYVCQGFVCKTPTTDIDEFIRQLAG